MFVSAVVPAAGFGKRLKSKTPKPLIRIGKKPIFIRTLETLSENDLIKEIILVANKKNLPELRSCLLRYRIRKVKTLVTGGRRRQDSVRNGLKHLNSACVLVLIHDAARPFVTQEIISNAINTAKKFDAAIAAVELKPTVKAIDSRGYISKTLERNRIFEIQTPQVFKKDLIIKAYDRFGHINVTDDSALVEKLSKKIKIVKGSYFNIKITTPEDLVFAEAILRKNKSLGVRL
ncbi:MAG: 2-C-methyl-D-erythritol 4-phosphate cytidylyltransferase [Candidatus Omnitrophica bacterium]|nr:2-C-methyl-D-erythritol 4-phosphate cytidylyltransferase [Candidatus Omnitrophota bacterium]